MVLSDEIHAVELVYVGQETEVTETGMDFYNECQRVEIDLNKTLEVDEAYGVGSNGEVRDVTFGLYATEELAASDGSAIPADKLIEVIFLDENGHVKVVSDLPMGSYYVQEISTNSAYLVSDEKYSAVFEYAGQETAIVNITANEGKAIENELIYGSVIAKLSRENEEYRAVRVEIESLYEKYPKVLGVFDTETSAELTEEECTALINVMELRNKLTDIEMQSVYSRGCYDSMGYLKKTGIL